MECFALDDLLADLFDDIEGAHPNFVRDKYTTALDDVYISGSSDFLTKWVTLALIFLTQAVRTEVGEEVSPLQTYNILYQPN